MYPDLMLTAGIACAMSGALLSVLAPDRVVARGAATAAVALATLVVGAGLLLRLPERSSLALVPELPWLSSRVVAFAALASGVVALALSPVLRMSRYDFAVLCVLVATAAAVPFAASAWLVCLLPLVGFTAVTASLAGRDEGREAAVLLVGCMGLVTVLGALGVALGVAGVPMGLWLLTLVAAPPLHSWYLRLAQALPLNLFAGVVILQASVLESAVIAVPEASQATLSWLLAAAALANSLLAVAQREARRAAACIVASQLAVAAFAEFSAGDAAVVGGTFMLLTVVTASTGFLLLLGALEARRGETLGLVRPHGCYASWPRLANAFLVLGLVSAGLPLTLGYVASDLVLRGAFAGAALPTVLVVVSGALNAMTMMKMYLYLFQGAAGRPQPSDLRPRELTVAFGLMLAAFAFAFGLLPN
ncbi:MAG: proton-conducting transporter membrane subunit [Gammaproteobacteria bacterium]